MTIIPIVIGTFGTVIKGLLKGLENLEAGRQVETIHTTALLRTARILKRVLKIWGDLLFLKLQWKTLSWRWCENFQQFWTKLWQPKKHNEKAEWINNITRELEGHEEGSKAEIHTDLLKTALIKLSKWKTPGYDGIHGSWFNKFTSIHDRLALEMNKCLQRAHVPEWMTKGRTTLILRDPNKGTAPNNYRPIIAYKWCGKY